MVTIHKLEVRFEVDGDGDEAVFGKLFTKYINRWSRAHEEAKRRERQSSAERSLGDQSQNEQ